MKVAPRRLTRSKRAPVRSCSRNSVMAVTLGPVPDDPRPGHPETAQPAPTAAADHPRWMRRRGRSACPLVGRARRPGVGFVTSQQTGRRGMSRERWMAAAFALGSLCFFVGPFPGYGSLVGATAAAATFFVGSLLFTAGGALQTWIAARDRHGGGNDRAAWWSAVIQSAGTLFFNFSTFRALQVVVGDPSYDRLVWRPDALGSICFLVSGFIAYRASTRHGWLPARRPQAGGSRRSISSAASSSVSPRSPATSWRRTPRSSTRPPPTGTPAPAPPASSPAPSGHSGRGIPRSSRAYAACAASCAARPNATPTPEPRTATPAKSHDLRHTGNPLATGTRYSSSDGRRGVTNGSSARLRDVTSHRGIHQKGWTVRRIVIVLLFTLMGVTGTASAAVAAVTPFPPGGQVTTQGQWISLSCGAGRRSSTRPRSTRQAWRCAGCRR